MYHARGFRPLVSRVLGRGYRLIAAKTFLIDTDFAEFLCAQFVNELTKYLFEIVVRRDFLNQKFLRRGDGQLAEKNLPERG